MRPTIRAVGVLAAALIAGGGATAHAEEEHERSVWSPGTGGPVLGHPATEILRARPVEEEHDFEADLPTSRAQLRALMTDATGSPLAERYDVGVTAGEPTMGITADGTLFYVGIGPDSIGSFVSFPMRSRDNGRTWQGLDVLVPGTNEDAQTQDPYLYVDRSTGRLFNVDWIGVCTPVSYSDDHGDSFDVGLECAQADHQTVFAGPPPTGGQQPSGYPNVVYYCAINGGALGAYGTVTGCSRSLNGGRTFINTLGIAYIDQPGGEGGSLGIPGHCGGATGHGVVGPDGTVYLPRGWCGQPYLAMSHDEGDTWERVQVADNGFSIGSDGSSGLEEHEASVAVDHDGNLYYAWPARDHIPYMATSRDGGKKWSSPVRIAPPTVNESWDVFLEAGDPGRVAVVYVASTNSPGPPFCVRTILQAPGCETVDGGPPRAAAEYEATTWNGYMAISENALSEHPTFTTAPVNPQDDPLIRGTCGPLRCQQEFDFLDVAVAPDGTAWGTFVDGCPPNGACPALGAGFVAHMTTPLLHAPTAPAAPPPSRRGAHRARCRARGTLEIRLPRRDAQHTTVTVAGRRARVVRRRGRLVARVRRYGLPAGRLTVRIVTRNGNRRHVAKRHVRGC